MAERAPFSRDEPVPLSADAFGHRDYTEALISIITDERPPPTVGVFGPWGVGKSTIIGGIQDRLDGGEIAFVYFDAWRYEGDSLRRQFLIDAANQLKNDGRLNCSYKPDEELEELHVEKQEVSESLGFSRTRMKHGLIALAIFAVIGLALYFTGVIDAVLSGKFGTAVLASVAAFAVGTFATILTQTVVIAPTTATTRALQDPDRFAAKFADLLGALKTRRLVVAIDNLDRCSPESAIEMLSTIKTYLEPAVANQTRPSSSAVESVDKQVVFVVSVDDKALRRHLVAKETERSRDEDQLAVRRYVDEYLAKFFSARLPIRAILPDDMRGYIADHLEPLIKARDLDEDHARELVNLVAAGLRRNPRRVKQFNNDLESRLRLLEERESGGEGREAGIDPPVSGDVRMVAKLALIETEWPEAFERLENHPPLLAKWEEQTETEDEIDWSPDEALPVRDVQEHVRGAQARRDFATFLGGQARSIQTSHLRAMLSLKQSPQEVGLPGFTEFRAAATSGDRALVEEILVEDSDVNRPRLVARLPEVLREEVSAGDLPAARAIVDLAVSVEAMQAFESERRRILTYAANTIALRRELGLLNPAAVLAGAQLVAPASRRHIYQPFLARFLNDELDDERRRSAGDALASFASELSDEQRTLVHEALADGPLRAKFSVYRRFAEEAPDQLPSSALRAALELAEAPAEGEEQPSLSAHPDAVAITTAALSGSGEAELQQRAVQLVLAAIRSHTAMPQLESELALGRQLLVGLEAAAAEHWSQLVQDIAANWAAYPGEAHPQLIGFIGEFLPNAASDAQEHVPASILALLFEDPNHGLAVIDGLDPVPEAFKAALLERLVAVGSEPNHWQAATDTLTEVAGEEAAGRIAAVFSQLIAAGHLDPAAQMLEADEQYLHPRIAELADSAAPHLVERLNSGELVPAQLFETLAAAMAEPVLESLAAPIAASLRDGAPENALQLVEALRQLPKSILCDRVAAHAVDLLLGLDAFTPDVGPLLSAVCADIARLTSDRQQQLASKLDGWLRVHPGQLSLLSQNILTIQGMAAKPAKTLVEGLLETERATEEPAVRRELLGAAFYLKGGPSSRTTAALRKRLGELEAGNEIDREIAAEFAARLA